jgi:hypothetical protein
VTAPRPYDAAALILDPALDDDLDGVVSQFQKVRLRDGDAGVYSVAGVQSPPWLATRSRASGRWSFRHRRRRIWIPVGGPVRERHVNDDEPT